MNVLVITNPRVYFRFKVTGKTKCGQTKRKMSLKKIPRYLIFHICNVNNEKKISPSEFLKCFIWKESVS